MRMTNTLNRQQSKRAVNVTLDSQLVAEAKAAKVGLSALFEEKLRDHLRDLRARQWLVENKDAIENYNNRIEKDGVFSDGLRRF